MRGYLAPQPSGVSSLGGYGAPQNTYYLWGDFQKNGPYPPFRGLTGGRGDGIMGVSNGPEEGPPSEGALSGGPQNEGDTNEG